MEGNCVSSQTILCTFVVSLHADDTARPCSWLDTEMDEFDDDDDDNEDEDEDDGEEEKHEFETSSERVDEVGAFVSVSMLS